MMNGYSTREVADMLDWPVSRVYGFVRSGIVQPGRDGRALCFGFRDLVVLRGAKALIDRRLSPARVREGLEKLREALPAGSPLSAARLEAAGNRVAIREGGVLWELGTGQATLDFANPDGAAEAVSEKPGSPDADDWFNAGVDCEGHDVDGALKAYRKALTLDGDHADAHVNIGRILQERGDLAGARHHYRRALAAEPDHPIARFNLGTALEDEGRTEEALTEYRAAAPDLPDARYNLARLYERLGQRKSAIAELKKLLRTEQDTR